MTRKMLIAFIVCLTATATAVQSQDTTQSSREMFRRYVADLQKNPSDNTLREKIIKLSLQLNPPPAVPEEANRHFVRGETFVKEAKTKPDYELAVNEYRQTLLMAPWWGDAYYDLGVALESAEDFDGAVIQFKLYLLSNPGEKEASEAHTRVYAIEAKKELASKRAAEEERATQAQEVEKRRAAEEEEKKAHEANFVGNWRRPNGRGGPLIVFLKIWRSASGDYHASNLSKFETDDVNIDAKARRVRIVFRFPNGDGESFDLVLSSDGQELAGRYTGLYVSGARLSEQWSFSRE